ncbi:hypothetical protein DP113_34225 (plasmid) [Brasilonema octagenarum UFV-E1]|uniref:Uncharacterized protein n=2 Tax=Brasilonema TaxID=383614 RepID=A0A856MRH5_9CYAN|nr:MULTISPECIES: hypothetical protein [Brasilonema]NMF62528.1 hypothetical protein [Brasilonema octagenarum UFV-OR1]QDL12780.1 hypothetical protein DP114_34115 [Brasilonema sennae CENA114]QDL19176.1 hypothetical protein DP113_34225 [Brasilonema octagenarum UFV-E1]
MDSNKRKIRKFLDSPSSIGEIGGVGGYAATSVRSAHFQAVVTVRDYFTDEMFLNQLTDRVYELLVEDLQLQRERIINYGQ